MAIPIQTDPISVVINGAALLVAVVQLCLMWKQQTRRREHQLRESVDDKLVDGQVRRRLLEDGCNAY